MKDVYTAEESSSDTAKDREAKITFLQKAIDALGLYFYSFTKIIIN